MDTSVHVGINRSWHLFLQCTPKLDGPDLFYYLCLYLYSFMQCFIYYLPVINTILHSNTRIEFFKLLYPDRHGASSLTEPKKLILNVIFKKYLFIYLFGLVGSQLQHAGSLLQHAGSLVAACELLVMAYGIQFPDQGSNPDPLHWERRVLAT